MPFTPFHWGPSSWVGLVFFKIFDFPTLLVANVVVDFGHLPVLISAFARTNSSLDFSHGFSHTFLGGAIFAAATAIVLYFLRNQIRKIMTVFRLAQNSSGKKILLTCFFGVYFHIILDSFLYPEMRPFYPLKGNPFLGLFSSSQIYLFCSVSLLIGLLLYLIRLRTIK